MLKGWDLKRQFGWAEDVAHKPRPVMLPKSTRCEFDPARIVRDVSYRSLRLFRSEGDHGVNFCGAAGGDPTRNKRRTGEHERGG